MPSSPTPPDRDAATPRRPRYTRGYIESYGQGRTCAEPTCATTLSRYNNATVCWRHARAREVAERRNQSS